MIIKAAIKQDGIVYTGHRHADIMTQIFKDGIFLVDKIKDFSEVSQVQGFVTDEGVFLNRVDALRHFIKAGQKSVLGEFRANKLFSEDLY